MAVLQINIVSMANIMEQFVAIIVVHSSEEPYSCMVQKTCPQSIVVIQKLKGKIAIWKSLENTIAVPSAAF